ncbi:discoidin domain-containing protein [Solwaraspora sp. WMMB335]|uniref:discoidin domain-containing protein n=1 Tax=Solwaraspora sp. WMMB335 TaxID=3404118 RepID=UPI003B9666CF
MDDSTRRARKVGGRDTFAADRAHALRTLFPTGTARSGQVGTQALQPYLVADAPPVDRHPRARRRLLPALLVAGGAMVAVAAVALLLWTGPVDPEVREPVTRGPAGAVPPGAVPSTTTRPATTQPAGAARPAAVAAATAGRPNTDRRNLALRRSATASSVEGSSYPPAAAVDGDPGTRWSSGFSDPQWLQVDLGQLWRISEVTLVWEHAHATAYRVDTSRDGRQWSTRYTTSAGAGGTVHLEMSGTDARYLRMYGLQRSNRYGYSLLELEVR